MPELGGHHADEAHLDRGPLSYAEAPLVYELAPVLHRRHVEVPGAPQRFLAQQLVDERRHAMVEETVQGSAEHSLGPPGNLPWQGSLAEQAGPGLVAKAPAP